MALLDKIGEFAKIAANKTEEITKTIGEKQILKHLQKNGQYGLGKITKLRLPAR